MKPFCQLKNFKDRASVSYVKATNGRALRNGYSRVDEPKVFNAKLIAPSKTLIALFARYDRTYRDKRGDSRCQLNPPAEYDACFASSRKRWPRRLVLHLVCSGEVCSPFKSIASRFLIYLLQIIMSLKSEAVALLGKRGPPGLGALVSQLERSRLVLIISPGDRVWDDVRLFEW